MEHDGLWSEMGLQLSDLNGNIIYAAQTESDDYPTMPYGTAYYDDSPNAAYLRWCYRNVVMVLVTIFGEPIWAVKMAWQICLLANRQGG